MFNDASKQDLEYVLLQGGRVIVYASHQLKKHKTIYPTHELECAEVDFSLKIWRHHLYEEMCHALIIKVWSTFSLREN